MSNQNQRPRGHQTHQSAQQHPLDVTTASIGQLRTAFANKTPLVGLKTVCCHPGVHIDEIAAITIFRMYGKKLFPQAENLGLAFVTSKMTEGMKETEVFWKLLKLGHLSIGCNYGPFDEHGTENECAATLVAKYLGVEKRHELQQMLQYVLHTDTKGDTFFEAAPGTAKIVRDAAQRFLPAAIVKASNATINPTDHNAQTEMILVMTKYLRYQIDEQKLFYDTRMQMLQSKQPYEVHERAGVEILFVEHSSPMAGKIARSLARSKGHRPSFTVIVNPAQKHFCILNDQAKKLDISKVVAGLRKHYIMKTGGVMPSDKVLARGETIIEAPYLYYHKNAQAFYNGAITQPDTPGFYEKIFSKEVILNEIEAGLMASIHEADTEKV